MLVIVQIWDAQNQEVTRRVGATSRRIASKIAEVLHDGKTPKIVPKADICSALAYVRFGPEADIPRGAIAVKSKLEKDFEKRFDGHFSRLGCRGVVTNMRIKLDARVLITKWLLCRSIDQQARGLFADDAMANRLTIGNHGRRYRTKRIIECVRRSCVLRDFNVVTGCF